MKPAPFVYLAPRSVEEALSLLAQHGDEAKILAGGQSLVPLMNFRLARPRALIDINGLAELDKTAVAGDVASCGALVRQREIERSADFARELPFLSEAVRFVGHPAIRNRGTVGGSLAHADPAAELSVAALALEARLELRSARGSRMLKAEDFHLSYMSTALAPDELLTRIDFPKTPAGTGWSFLEIARRQGDFAVVAVGALLGLDRAGKVALARIALGGVGPAPLRAGDAEKVLLGSKPSAETFQEAAAIAAARLEPQGDIHASGNYRRHAAGVLVRRALETARGRAANANAHG